VWQWDWTTRRARRVAATTVAVALGATLLAAAAPAPADNNYGEKIDPQLAAVAMATDPRETLPVRFYGKNLDGLAKRHHIRVRNKLDRLLAGYSGRVKVGQLKKLEADADLSYADLDIGVRPTATIDPVQLADERRKTIFPDADRAGAAWKRGLDGSGVGIAIIDSGILDRGTKDFGSRVVARDGFNHGADAYGHGTFVAHIAAGVSDLQADGTRFTGIAPAGTIYSYNVAHDEGTYSSDIIAGLAAVLENKDRNNIRVVVLALQENAQSSYLANALDTAVNILWKEGIVVVVAAGNRGAGNADFAPANSPHAITVGATDTLATTATDDDVVAGFSSSGTTVDGYAKPEILAPGRRITAFLPPKSYLALNAPAENRMTPEYATMSGTSFSAPQVAAAAALLIEQHPDWTPDQVKWVLMNTTRPVLGSTVGALDLDLATGFLGTPDKANKGVRPAKYGLHGSATADFKASGWTASGWTASGWTASGWTASGWTASGWTYFGG
jgi:serine protease AprX